MLACRGFPIMRVKMEQPSQTAPNAEQVPVPAIVKVENVTYRDRDTGDVIPYSKIEEDVGRLDNLCQLLKRWRAVSATALCAQCVQVPTNTPQPWSFPRSAV